MGGRGVAWIFFFFWGGDKGVGMSGAEKLVDLCDLGETAGTPVGDYSW